MHFSLSFITANETLGMSDFLMVSVDPLAKGLTLLNVRGFFAAGFSAGSSAGLLVAGGGTRGVDGTTGVMGVVGWSGICPTASWS